MEKTHLREILKDLRRELDETEHLDNATREQITGVMEDLHQLLDRSSEASTDHDALYLQQLRETVLRLQTSHPRLTSMIEHLCDMLNSIGI